MGLGVWVARVRRFAASVVSKRDLGNETASAGGDFLRKWEMANGGVLDPDDEILREIAPARLKRGKGQIQFDPWSLYERMRKTDPKIKALFQQRKAAVLAKGWRVAPNASDEESRAREVAEFVEAVLTGFDDFGRDLRELMDAIPVGWAISELIWEEREVVTPSGKRLAWVPACLKQRRQGRFGFTKEGVLKYQREAGQWEETLPNKFVVYSHAPVNENPYGLSECAEVFWWWYFKHLAIKWWQVFNEKFGMPTVVGYVPPGTSKKEKESLLADISRLTTEYALVMPNNMEAKLMEAQRYGTVNTYKEFTELADRSISEAITGQSLATGQATTGVGTRSQATVHNEVREEVVQADAEELMGVINSTLVRWIVDWNFGLEVPAPSWVIDYKSKDLAAKAALFQQLQGMGHQFGAKWLAGEFDVPYLDEDSDDVPLEPRGGAGGGGGEWPFDGWDDDEGEGEGDGEDSADDEEGPPKRRRPEADEDEDEEKKRRRRGGRPGGKRRVKPRRFSVSRETLAEAKRRRKELGTIAERCYALGNEAWGRVGEKIRKAAEESTSWDDLRVRLNQLRIDAELRPELAEAMAAMKIAGWLVAAAQLQRYAEETLAEEAEEEGAEGKAAQEPRRKAEGHSIEEFEPVEPSAAISWFRRLVPFGKDLLDRVADQVRNAAFAIAGIQESRVVAKVQDLVGRALEEGTTLEEFQKDLPDLMEEEGLEPMRPDRAETLFRTEIHRAYGAGRTEALRDEEIKSAFPLHQYVAIKDSRTRDTHLALDGFLAEPDDPFWLTKTPPWEPNCRCDVVPVTRKQIEERGLTASTTVTMPDGSEQDPRQWPTNPAFRGIGF